VTDGASLPLVIAHRGASREAPGNTPAAFEAAIAAGADAIELDVRRTTDGVLVVHHNASRRGVLVSMQTYSALVRRSHNEPPLLEAVVDQCAGRIALDVEIKDPGHEAEVLELVSSRFTRDQVLFTSFEESVIATVKQLDPGARCGLLLGPGRLHTRAQRYESLPFDLAERCGADLLVVHQWLAALRGRTRRPRGSSLLDEARQRGTAVMVWTVNGPQRLRAYLADARVAGIITDLPGLAVAARRELSEEASPDHSMDTRSDPSAGTRRVPPPESGPERGAAFDPEAADVTGPTRQPFPRRVRPKISR
jgi:glycerophosphoryl diester phosphodiesterase